MNLVEAAEAVRVARAAECAAAERERIALAELHAAQRDLRAARNAHEESCKALVDAAETGSNGAPPASKIGPVVTVNICPALVSDAALAEMDRALRATVLAPFPIGA